MIDFSLLFDVSRKEESSQKNILLIDICTVFEFMNHQYTTLLNSYKNQKAQKKGVIIQS